GAGSSAATCHPPPAAPLLLGQRLPPSPRTVAPRLESYGHPTIATLTGGDMPLFMTSTPERGHYSAPARSEAPPLTPKRLPFDLAADCDASPTLVPPESFLSIYAN